MEKGWALEESLPIDMIVKCPIKDFMVFYMGCPSHKSVKSKSIGLGSNSQEACR